LTHTFLVFVTVGLGHGVYRKLYTLIGGQRTEKLENHWIDSRDVSLSKKRTQIVTQLVVDGITYARQFLNFIRLCPPSVTVAVFQLLNPTRVNFPNAETLWNKNL